MIILGTNSIKDTGYDVANSLRFNSGSDDSLNRTTGTPTNSKKFTISVWIKRSTLAAEQLADIFVDTQNKEQVYFDTNDNFVLFGRHSNSTVFNFKTNRVFRDTSAWYHIVMALDTTQGTASNRFKIYVNGLQETSLATETYPAEDLNFFFNTASKSLVIGKYGGGGSNYNGYMSEYCFIDGQQLAADQFGEFDEDSGIWKPKDVSGLTFGNNGFYLDFEDSSALGNDVSGNNNDFTVNNLTAIDQSTDTCTNNFATLNPLIPSNGVFSEGNTIVTTTSSSWCTIGSTFGVTSGKWYWEVKADLLSGSTSSFYTMIGFVRLQGNSSDIGNNTTSHIGSNNGVGIYSANGNIFYPSSSTSYGSSYQTSGTIIGVALDLTNNYAYWSINGTWQNSGDPESGATGTGGYNISSFADGSFISPASSVQNYSSSNQSENEYNFGSPPYAISSGNTDGDGYGNFEYAVPANYYSLNSKNLAEYG